MGDGRASGGYRERGPRSGPSGKAEGAELSEGGVCGDFQLFYGSDNKVWVSNGEGADIFSNGTLTDGSCQMVTYVNDGANDSIYINGVLDAVGSGVGWSGSCTTLDVRTGEKTTETIRSAARSTTCASTTAL
jgi:hypothetical protein